MRPKALAGDRRRRPRPASQAVAVAARSTGTGAKGASAADSTTGPAPGPPPPCGVEKVLCRLMCMASTPRSPGRTTADDGVEVGAVAVEVGARLVHRRGDLDDLALEQAAGVGVGQHDRRDVGAERGLRGGEVDAAVGVWPGSASPCSRAKAAVAGLVPWAMSGTSTVRRWPWPRGLVGGADGQHAAQLAVGAGLGRQRHGRHAGQRLQPVGQLRRSARARPARSRPAAADGGRRSRAAAPSSR